MLTQTRLVSTSFWIVSEKPNKMGHYLFVIPATHGSCFSCALLYMSLFCLGESEHLAEGWDNSKIFVAIATNGCLYKVKSASSHS
jgi:hypothetical protein